MNRILWYIKQLFPLTYRTTTEEDGEKYFHVWKMWFGHVYKHDIVRDSGCKRKDVEWLVYESQFVSENPLMTSDRAREVLGFKTDNEYMAWAMIYTIKIKNPNEIIEIEP
jgi:hypothetical protein